MITASENTHGVVHANLDGEIHDLTSKVTHNRATAQTQFQAVQVMLDRHTQEIVRLTKPDRNHGETIAEIRREMRESLSELKRDIGHRLADMSAMQKAQSDQICASVREVRLVERRKP